MLAADIRTGNTVWKTERKELPSWGTPAVVEPSARPRPNWSRTRPTSSVATIRRRARSAGASAAARKSPRPLQSSPTASSSSRAGVHPSGRSSLSSPAPAATSRCRKGSRPTSPLPGTRRGAGRTCRRRWPIATSLYVLGNQGLLDAYAVESGDEVYRQRIPHRGSGFSASPVAADNRIYLSSEDGDIFVIPAGRNFSVAGRYPMGEPLMATPAIADGTLYVRGEKRLFAIGRRRE